MTKTYISILTCLLFVILISTKTKAQSPLFPNSVVSNDIDFILDTDPDTFTSFAFIGLDDKEMPGSGSGNLFDENTFVFEASFSSGTSLEIWCHSSFMTQAAAQEYVEKLCPRLGKLPTFKRDLLDHVVIHNGNSGAFAEIEGNFFVLYSQNMDARISTNDLEETVFHETVHASIQEIYGGTPAWTNAQSADPTFVTEYGQSLPDLEDMAESALFAYTYIKYPGRLPADVEDWLTENIPNRLEFFCTIYTGCSTSSSGEIYESNISVYPNPTNGKFTVMLEMLEKDSYINIFSITGTLVKSIEAKQGQNEFKIEELVNGVYFLSVPGYQTSRIIKQ